MKLFNSKVPKQCWQHLQSLQDIVPIASSFLFEEDVNILLYLEYLTQVDAGTAATC
jgi:hypothetical protein